MISQKNTSVTRALSSKPKKEAILKAAMYLANLISFRQTQKTWSSKLYKFNFNVMTCLPEW